MLFPVEAKFANVIPRIYRSYGLQNTDGHQIFGFDQASPHAHRSVKFVIVVFWVPGLTSGFYGINHQWRIDNDGGGRKSLFKRSRIDKGFEAGARLTPCLSDMIELIAVKVESAYQ